MVNFPDNFEDKTILVAGAAGFVPSHLAEFYLKKGARVIGIDNFITGSRDNISILERYNKFTFMKSNVYEELPDFSAIPIHYIFNLASPASPIDFEKIPLEIMRTNSEGTRNLLELARVKGARILEASTSEVYGDPEVHPQVETYLGNVSTIGPRSCYDESKRYAEAITMAFYRKYGVNTRIVRIFNTYGPRMRANDGRVVPNFINQALRGEDITVYGDGSQTRSFCFVSDLVDAMNIVMFQDDHTPFNIGNPGEFSILEAAELIIKLTGSSSKLINKDLPQDDPKKRRPNIDKIQAISDYDPKYSFEQGLKETVDFFMNA